MNMTKFNLTKWNLSCSTRNLEVVKQLKALGWKIKQAELSELI